MATLNQLIGGKIEHNGVDYNLVEIKHGGTDQVIWPATPTYTYQLVNVVIHYSAGNTIYASGSNYAWVTATVQKYQGQTLIEETHNVVMTPTLADGVHFTVTGNYIYGADLGTTLVTSGYSDGVTVTYEDATASAGNVTQEANTASSPVFDRAVVTCGPDTASVGPRGESATVYGYITRYFVSTWTSGHTTETSDHGGSLNVYVNGAYSTYISHGGTFLLSPAENQTLSSIDFDVKMAYASDTSYYDEETVTQEAGYYTYAVPVITSAYCEDVPAAGGVSYFVGTASQTRGWNGRTSGAGFISPAVTFNPAYCSGSDLEDNETARSVVGSSVATCTSEGKTATQTVYGYQEANTIEPNGYEQQKTYGQDFVTTQEQNPSVSISAGAYTSSGSPCPAGGGSCSLSYSASVQRRTQTTHPYTLVTTYHNIWTSGWAAPDEVVTTHGSDVDPWTSWSTVPATPTISGGDTWLDHDDEEVTISSRGTTTGSSRNATYTASYTALNGVTASDSVTLYQEANSRWEIIEHYRDIEITTTGTIPAAGGFFNLRYKSYYDHGSYKYTSGATSGTSQRDPDAAVINLFNCSYNGDSEIQVNGSIAWAAISSVYMEPNYSSSPVTASVDIDGEASDEIEQDAASVTYTLELYSGATHVTDGYEFDWSGQQYIISTLTLVDNGTNLHQYSFDKMPGSVADIGLNLRTGDIEVSGITRGMDDWFEVYEASSNQRVRFTINTNML